MKNIYSRETVYEPLLEVKWLLISIIIVDFHTVKNVWQIHGFITKSVLLIFSDSQNKPPSCVKTNSTFHGPGRIVTAVILTS